MHASNATDGRTTHRRTKIGGLSIVEEDRLRAALRRRSPSEPWVEAQIVEVRQMGERGEIIVRRIRRSLGISAGRPSHRNDRFAICRIFTPPTAMEDDACLDHREDGNWGPSPFAVTIRAEYYNLELVESELPPESQSSLIREIQEYGGGNYQEIRPVRGSPDPRHKRALTQASKHPGSTQDSGLATRWSKDECGMLNGIRSSFSCTARSAFSILLTPLDRRLSRISQRLTDL